MGLRKPAGGCGRFGHRNGCGAVKAKPASPGTCGSEGELVNDKFLCRMLWKHSVYITGESKK